MPPATHINPISSNRLPHSANLDQLLDTAATLFARFGLDGASLRDIGREAGMGAPLICYHFENKQGLYLEAFEHKTESSIDFINERVAPCQTPAERLGTLVRALFDLLASERELTALLQRDIIAVSLGEHDLLSRRVYKHFIAQVCQAASAWTGQPASERTAFSIMALILGYALLTHVRSAADGHPSGEALAADREALASEALRLAGLAH